MKVTAFRKTGFVAKVFLLAAIMIFTMINPVMAEGMNQSNSKNFFDVTQGFGGTGKGNADDSGSILAAAKAAEANKGILYFPFGTYKISQNITIPQSVTVNFEKGAKLSIDSGVTV